MTAGGRRLDSPGPPAILALGPDDERSSTAGPAGFTGPLDQCSIYQSAPAGLKLRAMLAMGASKPWQDAMQALSGERQGDAGAILEYFAPLRAWLKDQIKDEKCGW